MSKTDELIAGLTSQATPVRPLPPPATRTLAWFVIAIASAGAGVAFFGARRDIDVLVWDSEFLWTALLASATAVLAAGASLVLAIPGAERSAAQRIATLTTIGLWAATLVTTVALAGHGLAGASDWYVCFVRVMAIGFVPAVALFGMLRRSAPLRLNWTSALAMAAATAFGALAIQFICPVDDAGHALLGHFGPVLVLGALGIMMARALLRYPPSAAQRA